MRNVVFCYCVVFICLITSCSKSGWTDRGGSVGVMFLDGKELRENGHSNLVLGGIYGQLSLYRDGDKYYFIYNPRSLSNRMNTLSASLHLFCINDISLESFDEGRLFYSKGDNKYDPYLMVQKRGTKVVYEINSATVIISNLVFSQGDETILSFQIDYTIVLIDSSGETHIVEGWAKTDSLRQT